MIQITLARLDFATLSWHRSKKGKEGVSRPKRTQKRTLCDKDDEEDDKEDEDC